METSSEPFEVFDTFELPEMCELFSGVSTFGATYGGGGMSKMEFRGAASKSGGGAC